MLLATKGICADIQQFLNLEQNPLISAVKMV